MVNFQTFMGIFRADIDIELKLSTWKCTNYSAFLIFSWRNLILMIKESILTLIEIVSLTDDGDDEWY